VELTNPRLKLWIPAIVWAACIFTASTADFSAEHTGRFILPILLWLLPHAAPATLDLVHFFVRKSAHFIEYFIFSLLLFRAVRKGERGWQLRWALLTVILVAAYSVTDELHQLFVPGRVASPWDSLLDTAGAIAAQLVLWFLG
jgi:VanZ family protein